ncbi:DinB family protein [Microlunatus sp. Gsoil 973]|uniref:DinB family protein n=1 Tax=Microlunatus sp. Gsoil 973 TaxID=2672569 RepID=UPI0012B4D592|nr:DinB family protein [Microlunatus sp. Gsoil 973]QGN33486.1 DinB family protein [Microlunatus sp. Gsoil 973]
MAATFGRSDDLKGASFDHVALSGARFVASDLSAVVMRGVDAHDLEIDDPWLVEGGGGNLIVNGVNIAPYVDAQLNQRFPGRDLRVARHPDGLRDAWAAVEATWTQTCRRVAAMPPGTVDISVAGEWSFAQTLRHLVLATDMWLGKAVLEVEQPFHPIGLSDSGGEADSQADAFAGSPGGPPYDEVLAARADRLAMVRGFLATVSTKTLAQTRKNPHAPEYDETVLSCLHTILEEEWEHHRYAVRDLDAIERERLGA